MLDPTLAQVRRLAQQYLLDSYEFLIGTRAVDRYGRETTSYAVIGTVKGQLSSTSGSERQLLASLTDSGLERLETAKLSLPWATSLGPSEFVRKVGSSKVWDVRHVSADETLGVCVIALLTREVPASE